ncbi:unnamed protein product, partial [Iphiclides podalirius]
MATELDGPCEQRQFAGLIYPSPASTRKSEPRNVLFGNRICVHVSHNPYSNRIELKLELSDRPYTNRETVSIQTDAPQLERV